MLPSQGVDKLTSAFRCLNLQTATTLVSLSNFCDMSCFANLTPSSDSADADHQAVSQFAYGVATMPADDL